MHISVYKKKEKKPLVHVHVAKNDYFHEEYLFSNN